MSSTHAAVNHESQYVLYAIIAHDAAHGRFPKALVVGGTAALHRCPHPVNIFGLRYCNLKVRGLLISLKAQQILSHYHLHRINCWLVLSKLAFEVVLERVAIVLSECHRRSDV